MTVSLINLVINHIFTVIGGAVFIYALYSAIKVFNDKQVDRNERFIMAMSLVSFMAGLVVGMSSNIFVNSLSIVFLVLGWVLFFYWKRLCKKHSILRKQFEDKQLAYLDKHPELFRKINRLSHGGLVRSDIHAVMKVNIDKIINDYKKSHKQRK